MKIAIIVNNQAKNSHKVEQYTKAFSQVGLSFEIFKLEPKKLEFEIKKCIDEFDILLVGGGDGTVRSGAHLSFGKDIILGILPLGTLNHFAKECALPLSPDAMAQALKKANYKEIDVSFVNDKLFVNNASIGFYPLFVQKREYYNKFYNKWLSYIPGFIQALQKYQPLEVTLSSKSTKTVFTTLFLLASNNLYSFHFPINFKRDDFAKNQLGVYFLRHGRLRLLNFIRYYFRKKSNFVEQAYKEPIEIDIKNMATIDVALDGERITLKLPLRIRNEPKALKILCA